MLGARQFRSIKASRQIDHHVQGWPPARPRAPDIIICGVPEFRPVLGSQPRGVISSSAPTVNHNKRHLDLPSLPVRQGSVTLLGIKKVRSSTVRISDVLTIARQADMGQCEVFVFLSYQHRFRHNDRPSINTTHPDRSQARSEQRLHTAPRTR